MTSDFRYYIYENIYKSFNLGNLGAIGAELNVSVLVAVLAAAGWVAGMLTAVFTRNKAVSGTLPYWLAGMFAVVALLFTPYNLQLLMPTQIMQNIAMIGCIAHIVFMFADMWVFAWALCRGIYSAMSSETGAQSAALAVIVAAVLALLTVIFKWHFAICIAVYAGVLVALNTVRAVTDGKVYNQVASCNITRFSVACAAVTLLFVAVLAASYFVTEAYIAIV